ncbi:MAG: type I-C CRISPR-associated protein Cas8c/Csd1 [Desulfohalobiaceae bacterium]
MMLQALTSYYDRLVEDPDSDVPQPGFSKENVHFELVLSASGELLQVNDIRMPPQKGKSPVARKLSVPKDKGRTSAIHPYFLWDKTKYALGAEEGKEGTQLCWKHFDAFRDRQREVAGEVDDEGVRAVCAFLDQWDPERAPQLELWREMAGGNVVFRLDGERQYVHERPGAQQTWLDFFHSGSEEEGICLATGEQAPIAKLHPSIKGVRGAKPSGAYLVSFNMDAFSSYGKDQGYNAPVSQKAAFAYATALNHLLRQDSPQKVQVGDATTVFWSERPTHMESFFAAVMGGQVDQAPNESHDTGVIKDLRDLLKAVSKGQEPPRWDDPETPFYILGLSGNSSRLAVRFWHVSSVGRMARNLARHFSDLAIEHRYDRGPEYPGLWRLLVETAALRRSDNISPVLAGEFMRSVITGGEYPASLMSQILSRIRAENEVTTLKAALLKAVLVRQARNRNTGTEVSMSLDTQATDAGYLLGRLFAVLEKVQQDSHGGSLNATIRDRFFGAASATPRSIFPRLLSLSQHHLAKLRKENEGYAIAADKRLQEVLDGINDIPAHLNMQEQARFALGYYHQRNALYRKKEDNQPEEREQA